MSETRRHGPDVQMERALRVWRMLAASVPPDFDLYHQKPTGVLHNLQRSRCYLCRDIFQAPHGGRMARSRDHVFSQQHGGGDDGNILLAHRLCNEAKDSRAPYACEVLYLFSIYAPEPNFALRDAMKVARA